MICKPCQQQNHAMCDGKTWCDCQHRKGSQSSHAFIAGDGINLWVGRCCVEGCHKLAEEHEVV